MEKERTSIFKSLDNLEAKKRRVFHPYFTSQPHSIVSEYIKFFSKPGEIVLDPYVGSGVTLLEAQLLQRQSIGIDLSSFACFISEISNKPFSNLDLIKSEFQMIKSDISGEINLMYKQENYENTEFNTPSNLKVKLPSNSDAETVEHLFTKRNLIALDKLKKRIDQINNKDLKQLYLGIFSGLLHRASKTFFYDKLNWGGGNSGIFTKYRYWIPNKPDERNVWELFEIRYKRILSLIEKLNNTFSENYTPKVLNESATDMKSVKGESIDYIYTDPPYGANIAYLDLSTMWNSWLELDTDLKNKRIEVIEGGDLSKTQEDYINLLVDSFKEMFRVLKKDKYLSVAFSHKDLNLWYEILKGCEDCGFEYVNTLYYSSYYKSFHKIKNPLRVLSGQMIINFKKVDNPRKITKHVKIDNLDNYIVSEINEIIDDTGGLSTEKIFNKLLPKLLEEGIIKNGGSKMDIIKLLEDNFEYDSLSNIWKNSKSVLMTISEEVESFKNKFDTILLDFPIIQNESELRKHLPLLTKNIKNSLDNHGTLWVTCENSISGDKVIPIPFILAEKFKEEGFFVQNILVWVHKNDNKTLLNGYYKNILFLTLEKKDFFFDKDKIREKHIWAGIEWGKREFRYNKSGKDPGNFWLPTDDDGKGNITKHIELSEEDKDKRILSCSTKLDSCVGIITNKSKDYLKNIVDGQPSKIKLIKYKYSPEVSKSFVGFEVIKSDESINKSNVIKHNIIFGTSEKMVEIKDKSVKLIVTSPPYWDLKDYKNKTQIGYKETYEEYHKRLKKVWSECMRVLKDEGSIWININSRKIEGDYFGIQYDIIKNMNNLGFKLIEVLIWHKSSGIPVNSKNLTDRFEYILGFVKSNLRKIKLNHIAFKDYLFSNTNYEEPINIWNMNRRSGSIGKDLPHPAIYPDELPQRLISILTQKGDTVLDPFLGSGTTTVAAINKGRSSVGFEINPEFKKLISLRINQAKNNLECSQQNVEYQERD